MTAGRDLYVIINNYTLFDIRLTTLLMLFCMAEISLFIDHMIIVHLSTL